MYVKEIYLYQLKHHIWRKEFQKKTYENLFIGLGKNGAKFFFYFPIYLIQK